MMSWTDSLIFAATLAVVCSIGIEKIMVMDWDFTELLPSNRRRANETPHGTETNTSAQGEHT
ncbi:MAG: hypothetical protein V8Q42_11015 [Anaerovoracaceae bacterium]